VKVFAGSLSEIELPSTQVWFAVCVVSTGGPMTVAENVLDTHRPLVSVALTLMVRVSAVSGAVPLNVSVAALKPSQPGSAWPFDKRAA
jgi:hypothetical protein